MSITSLELAPNEQAALDDLVHAIANVMALKKPGVETLAVHVEEWGTGHEGGAPVDYAVADVLTVILDQM